MPLARVYAALASSPCQSTAAGHLNRRALASPDGRAYRERIENKECEPVHRLTMGAKSLIYGRADNCHIAHRKPQCAKWLKLNGMQLPCPGSGLVTDATSVVQMRTILIGAPSPGGGGVGWRGPKFAPAVIVSDAL